MNILAIFIAFGLMQASAWLWVNQSDAGLIVKTLATILIAASAAIFAYQHGIETGLSFSILLMCCLMLFNIMIKRGPT